MLIPVAAAASLLLSLRPFRDPDVYWHVRLGAEILARHSVSAAGSGWSILPPVHSWISPEWLADILLHWSVVAFGWRGPLVFQVVASLIFYVLLALVLLRRVPARSGAFVFTIVVVTLAPLVQPRPQTLSLCLLIPLAGWIRALLVEGAVPSARWVLPVVFVWAQLHGLWLLAPASLVLAGGLRLLDRHDGEERRRVLRVAVVALGSLAIGLANPLGVASLTLPARLHAATVYIEEWRPTTFQEYFTWGLPLLVAAIVLAWLRSEGRIPRAEQAWVAACLVFGLTAYRNVGPAVLLLAPIVVTRLGRTSRRSVVEGRERRVLSGAVAILSLLAVAIAIAGPFVVRPIPRTTPVSLIRELDDGQPHRVLDDYNLGGAILVFGGPDVRVAVDGRADYYGRSYLVRYQRLMEMAPGWRRLFEELRPDTALIATGWPLRRYLLRHGWVQVDQQGSFALLHTSMNRVGQ